MPARRMDQDDTSAFKRVQVGRAKAQRAAELIAEAAVLLDEADALLAESDELLRGPQPPPQTM